MLISLIITFIVGNLLGALMVWGENPKALENRYPGGDGIHLDPADPFRLLLMWVFAAKLQWFPVTGAYA